MSRLLPRKKTLEPFLLSTIRMLVYGAEKIGKTTFASHFPNTCFLITEKGQKGMNLYKEKITNWPLFLEFVKEIIKGRHDFETFAIDTIDNLFYMCQEYVCKKHKISHPSDLQYGKGWSLVKLEFQTPILQLAATEYGLIFISHSKEEEIKRKVTTKTKTSPTMSNQARSVINPVVDIIGACGFRMLKRKGGNKNDNDDYKEIRIMSFKPSDTLVAGDRSGLLPDWIRLPKNKRQFEEFFASYFEDNDE